MQSLPFEPMIRWRASGALRLSWAYVERFHDSLGQLQVRSNDIPGGITDRWLRRNYPDGGASRRKHILSYTVPLRRRARAYSDLLVYVGGLKARVRRAASEAMNGVRPVAGAEAIEAHRPS